MIAPRTAHTMAQPMMIGQVVGTPATSTTPAISGTMISGTRWTGMRPQLHHLRPARSASTRPQASVASSSAATTTGAVTRCCHRIT